jgi:Zn-dependent peptidase ImmA (M78 family)
MTFIPEARFEARAAELWQRHGLVPGFDVERLLDDLGLGLVWDEVADDHGGRVLGQLIPEERLVVLNERHRDLLEDKEGQLRRYTVGHEIGHWEFHADAARSGTLSLFDGERIWCRDRSRDPAERQAEMFSAALLVSRDHLLAALPPPPWRGWRPVYRLADAFLVNVTPMTIRLEKLGWMHRDEHGEPVSGPAPRPGQEALFGT